MNLVPESDEVIEASLDDLVEALDLASMVQDLTDAANVLRPKFLQGGPFLIQHTVVILGTLFTFLEVMSIRPEDFSFKDLWDADSDAPILMDEFFWPGDEAADVVETLVDCFRRHDVENFKRTIAQSYFLGFTFFCAWFLPLVACMAVMGEMGSHVLEDNEQTEDDEGS